MKMSHRSIRLTKEQQQLHLFQEHTISGALPILKPRSTPLWELRL